MPDNYFPHIFYLIDNFLYAAQFVKEIYTGCKNRIAGRKLFQPFDIHFRNPGNGGQRHNMDHGAEIFGKGQNMVGL